MVKSSAFHASYDASARNSLHRKHIANTRMNTTHDPQPTTHTWHAHSHPLAAKASTKEDPARDPSPAVVAWDTMPDKAVAART